MKTRKFDRRMLIVIAILMSSVFIHGMPSGQGWAAQSCQEYDVQMRDGVFLYTRVFLPDPAVWGSGPYPTIVTTTPYGIGGYTGRGKCSSALPVAQATNGYAFIYQERAFYLREALNRPIG